MSNSFAEKSLFFEGKNVCKNLIFSRSDAILLDDFLDLVITCESIKTEALFKRLKWLVAQGTDYETFKEKSEIFYFKGNPFV